MSDFDKTPPAAGEANSEQKAPSLGIAGGIARAFIDSPLSPLLYVAMLALGILGLIVTPRQEDPQIKVPLIDLIVAYPGTEAEQVAALAVQPLERLMFEIDGVKHVYSATQRGMGVVTIQFEVGEDMEPSLVKVNDKLEANRDRIPPGVIPPQVKAKSIDDVPAVNITLWSEKDYNGDGVPDVDDSQLRRLAQSVLQHVKEIPDTGNSFVVGGRAEQVIVEVFPERLAGYGLSVGQVAQAIQGANREDQMGGVESAGSHRMVVSGSFLQTVDDINALQVGIHNGVPVYVYDVADVRQGPEDAKQTVAYYTGAAAEDPNLAVAVPAVTIAVAKKKGTNGVAVAEAVIQRVNDLKGVLIPNDVHISITRDYGTSADDKVKDLIFKLFIATGFVFLLVWAAFRALRPAIVVLLVIPVVLLFTILCAWLLGFTIDRVSLFALIFSIGILVDDAIVVVENIYRRWLEAGETDQATAVDAVREVGNPTILATGTVIGALLPMGFVSGMMGPYMMPIPVLGSVAMGISLFAAFVFTPWLAIHRWFRPSLDYLETAEKREHAEAEKLDGLYRRILLPMIADPRKARMFKLAMWGTFLVMCSFFYFKWVAVKMLPLDNKPEFAVVLDMPEGTALAVTGNTAHSIADKLRMMPEVRDAQIYVGTSRPFDFNGMVRHYYMRNQPWQAEIQLQLTDKRERDRSSHEIAVDARAQIKAMLAGSAARFAVVEMPPGPPVLQSVVAEVHGPDAQTRREVARNLTSIFAETESLVDVDNYMREPYDYWHFEIDYEKAQRRGITVEDINRELAMALGGFVLGDVKQLAGHEPINIVVQIPLAERSNITRLGDILVHSSQGVGVPLRELGNFELRTESEIIYHKDLRAVEYVVADVGGKLAAPVYGMFQVEDKLKELGCQTPDNSYLCDNIYWTSAPPSDRVSSFEWAGEWTVTYETFRDMGIAFGAALILIYILVVWEFGNFRIPALIMAPIPLTLLGIIPAHMVFFQLGLGGEFTATSMIGWIALAGIIVRNSILLVDFSVHKMQGGADVVEAVIAACKTRTRPILITAFALVAGSSVIFFDPIFQGMAISLAFGVLVSTVLTLVVIPLGCVAASGALCEVAGLKNCAPPTVNDSDMPAPAAKSQSQSKSKPENAQPLWVRAWSTIVGALINLVMLVVSGIAALRALFGGSKPKGDAPTPTPPPSGNANVAKDRMMPDVERPTAPPEHKAAMRPDAGATKTLRETASASEAAQEAAPSNTPAVESAPARDASAKRTGKKIALKKPLEEKGEKNLDQAPSASAATADVGAPVEEVSKSDAEASDSSAKKSSGRRGIRLKTPSSLGDDGLNKKDF